MGHHADRSVDVAEIFNNWKQQRFVITESNTTGLDIDCTQYPYVIVLADVGFWKERDHELRPWCEQNNCELKGMIIKVPAKETLTLFCLRWT